MGGSSSKEDASPDWSSTSLSELEWQQMPNSGSAKGMLEITPADDLVFPFETLKDAVCCMTLKNTTAYYDVAYWIQTTRPERYRIQSNISIISPWSSTAVNVIMVAQNEAPPDMECKDKFLVRSAALKDDTTIKGLNKEMFQIDPAYVVDCVKLGVVLKPRPPKTDVMVFQPPTRDGVDLWLQDIGSTLHHMTLQHLKEITNNFSNEGILGRGGFGVVYKGVLGNGKIVAVKKLVQSMSTSQEQFENEVTILMKLKHPNIVQLLGYCYETQHLRNIHKGKSIFAENTECLLCLECLPKGSLEKYISDASSGLDWSTRYRIIEGISYGLQYLHEQVNGPIIHSDLKPGNILLDENMIPKITDFGISRQYDREQTVHTAKTSGTLGYMPPEYLRGIVTPMFDIFSLGVIIMEVITGHRDYPYEIKKSSKDFIELELQKWRNVLENIPGYTLLETDCQQIKRCIQIGLVCVNPERAKRPTMKKLIDMLAGLESMNWYISNEVM